MLTDLANPAQQFWLLGLLILWALFLFGGFAFGTLNEERTRRMPAWTRIASSLTMVVAAWSWYVFTFGTAVSTLSLCLAIGMTLGCLGDLFLAGALPLPQPVLGGIAAFGLGHIAYIIGLLSFGNQQHLDTPGPRWACQPSGCSSGWPCGISSSGAAASPPCCTAPRCPTRSCWQARLASPPAWLCKRPPSSRLPLARRSSSAATCILAAQLFNHRHFPLIGDVIWLTYGPAQALIVYSVASALVVVGK